MPGLLKIGQRQMPSAINWLKPASLSMTPPMVLRGRQATKTEAFHDRKDESMSCRRGGTSRKKGPTKGSGGKGRRKLAGKGPTPKAADRTWHKNYRPPAKQKKSTRTNTDAVAARNPVVEALEAKVPATTLYVSAGVEMDDR